MRDILRSFAVSGNEYSAHPAILVRQASLKLRQ